MSKVVPRPELRESTSRAPSPPSRATAAPRPPARRPVAPAPPREESLHVEGFPTFTSLTPRQYRALIDELIAFRAAAAPRPWKRSRAPAQSTAPDPALLWAGVAAQPPIEGHRDDEPAASTGVYHLLDQDGRLLYVGKTKNWRGRLRAHARNYERRQAGFTTWRLWVVHSEQDRVAIEAHLIATLDPPLNGDATTRARRARADRVR